MKLATNPVVFGRDFVVKEDNDFGDLELGLSEDLGGRSWEKGRIGKGNGQSAALNAP